MRVKRQTINVIQLGLGFFFVLLAFDAQGFIEQPVMDSVSKRSKFNQHLGYYSLATIFAVSTFANFITPPIVDLLTAKWAMALAAVFYFTFQAGFLRINEAFLFISSALVGFGDAIIWAGQGQYLAMNCDEETTSRNSSLLWAIFSSSLPVGGAFLFIVFHSSKTSDNISDGTIRILYTAFAVVTVIGILIFALLRTPHPEEKDAKECSEKGSLSFNKQKHNGGYWDVFLSTFRLLSKKRMLLLSIAFGFTGLSQSFWTGIYPTCISFTMKLGNNTNSMLAIASICQGLGQIFAGGLFGIVGSYIRIRSFIIVFFGTFIHLIACGLIFISLPIEAPIHQTHDEGIIEPRLWLVMLCGFLFTFADGCWNTQINTILVSTWPEESSQAFSLFRFYQSAFVGASFIYGSVLNLRWQLLIMTTLAVLGSTAFFIVENINDSLKRKRSLSSGKSEISELSTLPSNETS